MKRMFPKLGPRAVEFKSCAGAVFFVRMLPVRWWDDFNAITEEARRDSTPEGLALGRARVRAILETVWPEEYRAELLRLDFAGCVEVATLLFFGETREEKRAKGELKRRPDLEFLAAQMLAIYPGYTLDTLLDLPAPVFFRLQELAPRVRADDALERYRPAVGAALSGGEVVTGLNAIRGSLELPAETDETPEQAQELTPEQAADLDAQLDQILAGNYRVIGSLKPGRVK